MKKNKTIVTITGIRPDFIRMSEIFKLLDKNFNHICIHTGQHFDKNLSSFFFNELKLRKPNYNLKIGSKGRPHYVQNSVLNIRLLKLFKDKKIYPDLIIFLGDSNSVCSSVALKKEGYKICHIEAGMRSGDKRMLEEINRIVCDHCSDLLMVYHKDYKRNLIKENINSKNIFVVGNTIKEVFKKQIRFLSKKKVDNYILVDIHRPENFNYSTRMKNILKFLKYLSKKEKKKIMFLNFKSTIDRINKFRLNKKSINIVPLMNYIDFLNYQNNAFCLVSDSGTAQEETALLKTPVIVPRDFTERPQSYHNNCSKKVNVNKMDIKNWNKCISWIRNYNKNKIKAKTAWLGDGKTSKEIIKHIKKNI